MRKALFAATSVLCALCAFPAEANTLYKCTDSSGVILYTNQKAYGKNCIVLSHQPASVAPGIGNLTGGSASSSRPRASATPTPGDFPRVSGNEQKARDTDRRVILDKEMANEQQNLDKAKKSLAEAGAQPPEKTQALRDTVSLHERNIEALKKELANLR